METICAKNKLDFENSLKMLTGILTWSFFFDIKVPLRNNFYSLEYEDYYII